MELFRAREFASIRTRYLRKNVEVVINFRQSPLYEVLSWQVVERVG